MGSHFGVGAPPIILLGHIGLRSSPIRLPVLSLQKRLVAMQLGGGHLVESRALVPFQTTSRARCWDEGFLNMFKHGFAPPWLAQLINLVSALGLFTGAANCPKLSGPLDFMNDTFLST